MDTAVSWLSMLCTPVTTSWAHETLVPSFTHCAALLRTAGVTRLSVPSSSSAPHLPQLERWSNQDRTSDSVGFAMAGFLPTATSPGGRRQGRDGAPPGTDEPTGAVVVGVVTYRSAMARTGTPSLKNGYGLNPVKVKT